ncbi:MAG: signal peptidase I [Clostridia bacterium]|nr:signal peptidase I [Clostridia bacterium]
MDRFGDFIGVTLQGLNLNNRRRKEVEDEIRDHLEMAKRELLEAGETEEKAEIEAIRRFGEAEDIRSRFKGIFTPWRRIIDTYNEKRFLKECFQWAITILGALIISLSIRSYAFAQTEVRQESMQNTLFEGQRLVELKIGYYFSDPERGDIVIINRDNDKKIIKTFIANTKEFIQNFASRDELDRNRLVKRIIGIPGDCIEIKEGKVYINGEVYEEPYVQGITLPKDMKLPLTVPENQYFVLGDNRENSLDSRDIGMITKEHIEGKVVYRLWPLDKFGTVDGKYRKDTGGE